MPVHQKNLPSLSAFKGPDAIQVRQAILAIQAAAEGGGGVGSAIIDLGESAVKTGWSRKLRLTQDATLFVVAAQVDSVSAATECEFQVFRNGANVGDSFVLPAGESYVEQTFDVPFSAGDSWQMRVVNAATDATGLVFFGGFA